MNIIRKRYKFEDYFADDFNRYLKLLLELVGPRKFGMSTNSGTASTWDECKEYYTKFMGKPFDIELGNLFWFGFGCGDDWAIIGWSTDQEHDGAYDHVIVCIADDALAVQFTLMSSE